MRGSQGQSGLPSTVGEGVVCVLGCVKRQRENKEKRRRREERKINRKKRIFVLFCTVFHCLVVIYNLPNSTSGMLRLEAWATGSSRTSSDCISCIPFAQLSMICISVVDFIALKSLTILSKYPWDVCRVPSDTPLSFLPPFYVSG